ncbi:MAG: hypothetical protein ABR567_01630 [Myxococcales bacterium]
MHTRVFALTAAALAACGGGITTTPGQSSSCSVTLSGAVTGTFNCQYATTAWASSNNLGAFAFSAAGPPAVTVAIGFTGEPHTGAYKNTDAGAESGITVTNGSGASAQYWVANVGDGSTPAGSYTLNFTSVSNAITVSNGKGYSVEGTLDATLPAVSGTGATGTVTLHATF